MAALDDRCELLEQAWSWWGDAVAALDTDTWQRSTRLPDWNIGALVAHHAMFVSLLGFVASQPVGDPPAVLSARDMLRRFNEPDGVATTAAGVVSQMAQQQAAERSAAQFVTVFRETAPEVLANVRAGGPIVVEYVGNGTFPLTEVLSIGVLEAVVHGLDLRAAAPSRSPSGTRRTKPRSSARCSLLLTRVERAPPTTSQRGRHSSDSPQTTSSLCSSSARGSST
jgi:uncharacterized protein (TIGR03083 family)